MSETWCALASGLAAAKEAGVECGAKTVREREERNKTNVVAFYELMFNDCKPAPTRERYWARTSGLPVVELMTKSPATRPSD